MIPNGVFLLSSLLKVKGKVCEACKFKWKMTIAQTKSKIVQNKSKSTRIKGTDEFCSCFLGSIVFVSVFLFIYFMCEFECCFKKMYVFFLLSVLFLFKKIHNVNELRVKIEKKKHRKINIIFKN